MKVNGVEVNARNVILRKELNKITSTSFVVDGTDYDIGMSVNIPELGFSGYIVKVQKGKSVSKIWAVSMEDEVKQFIYSKIWENTSISQIVSDILTASGVGFEVDTTETPTLKKFAMHNDNAYTIIVKLLNSIGWRVIYNYNSSKLVVEPYKENDVDIDVGVNLTYTQKPQVDDSNLVNDVIVVGGKKHVRKTDTFTGDGSTKEFQLSYPPEHVEVKVDGNIKIGGEEGVSTDYDYVVDREKGKIIFVNAPANNSNIEVNYSYLLPIQVESKDDTSIQTYGRRTKRIVDYSILSMADARVRARKVLSIYSQPKITIQAKVLFDVEVGDIITIENNKYLVKTIEKNLNSKFTKITATTYNEAELNYDIAYRLKKLEEEASQTDVIQKYMLLNEQIKTKLSWKVTIKKRRVNGSLIWDNENAIWDGENVVWGPVYPLILDNVTYGKLDEITNRLVSQSEDWKVVEVIKSDNYD